VNTAHRSGCNSTPQTLLRASQCPVSSREQRNAQQPAEPCSLRLRRFDPARREATRTRRRRRAALSTAGGLCCGTPQFARAIARRSLWNRAPLLPAGNARPGLWGCPEELISPTDMALDCTKQGFEEGCAAESTA